MIISSIYGLAVFLHLPLLSRDRHKRDTVIFSVLVTLALVYSCSVLAFPTKVPNPTNLINRIFMGFGKRFFAPQ
jgi:hypothetical protein